MNFKKVNLRLVVFFSVIFYPFLWVSTSHCTNIEGIIHYNGTSTGTLLVAALSEGDLTAVVCQNSLPAPGAYTLSCPPGDYYIVAQLDIDGSGSLSFENPLESFGSHEGSGSDGMVIVGNENLQGIDIYLSEIKIGCDLTTGYTADYFSSSSHGPQDMGFHDGFLWLSEATWEDQLPDLHKIDSTNGNLVESINLSIGQVFSLEWIGNDLWVCYKDNTSWKLKKFFYDGTSFTPDIFYALPSSTDWNVIWSINIAWDGNLMWVQEKGEQGNIYKINLTNGTIEQTISSETFGWMGAKGISDISDICFSDDMLWAMDDGNPIIVKIDPVTFEQHQIYFAVNQQYFGDDGKYTGMVKEGEEFYFFQKNSEGSYKIYAGSLCKENISNSILWLTLPAILNSAKNSTE